MKPVQNVTSARLVLWFAVVAVCGFITVAPWNLVARAAPEPLRDGATPDGFLVIPESLAETEGQLAREREDADDLSLIDDASAQQRETVDRDAVLELLDQEIELAEQLSALRRQRHESGNASLQKVLEAERELLDLQIRKASLSGRQDEVKRLYEKQLVLLKQEEETIRTLVESGRATVEDHLQIRRRILALQRRQLEAGMRSDPAPRQQE